MNIQFIFIHPVIQVEIFLKKSLVISSMKSMIRTGVTNNDIRTWNFLGFCENIHLKCIHLLIYLSSLLSHLHLCVSCPNDKYLANRVSICFLPKYFESTTQTSIIGCYGWTGRCYTVISILRFFWNILWPSAFEILFHLE